MDETSKPQEKRPVLKWILLGIAVVITAVWLILTPEGLLGKADAVGYAVCHRIEARTFQMGERHLPMCARCSGLFLGAVLGLMYHLLHGRKGKMPPVWSLTIFGFLALLWALDGVNSFLMLLPSVQSLYQTQNWTRLVTGTGMGLAISAVLWPSFIQTMLDRWEDTAVLGTLRGVVGLLVESGFLIGSVLVQVPYLLYPLSLLSAAGVIILLTMVYSMVYVMVAKKENTYSRFKELLVPLLAGFILAMLQIGAIDLLRYLWTGTWAGFNL